MSDTRVVCTPDTRIQHGLHKHKCKDCGTCWFHDLDELDMQLIGRDEFRKAHSCPSCGRETREKFFANKEEQRHSHAATCALQEMAGLVAMLQDLAEGNSIPFSEV